MSNNAVLKFNDEESGETVLSQDEVLRKISDQLDSLHEIKNLDERLKILWKLDKLDRLTYLAELQRLDKLGALENLQEMENLQQLDNLRHLKHLDGLKGLVDLSKLDKLNHLMRLKSLNKLEELQALDQLKDLDKLSRLKELDKLSLLNKLDVLKKIEKLDVLHKVEDLRVMLQDHSDDFQKLDNLKYIEKLDSLKKLSALESLDNLKSLDSLAELDKLTNLRDLSKLDKLNKLNELANLDRLDSLAGLERLNKLDELRHLERLDSMQDLAKLDYLKDAKVQTALKGLDKLSLFQENSKKFFLKLFASILVDVIKIGAISVLLLFIFTKNISRQTFDRLVPYLGFGEADRVNVALSILANDLSSGDFDVHFKNLENRIKREAASVFDSRVTKNLDHYRLLENLTAYNYKHESYDLTVFTKKELNDWAVKTHKAYTDSYQYDMEMIAKQPQMASDLDHYMKASIFIKQQKFLEGFVEMNQVKNTTMFASIGHGLTYAFYMAFRTKPIELKLYLEK